jgi:KH domain
MSETMTNDNTDNDHSSEIGTIPALDSQCISLNLPLVVSSSSSSSSPMPQPLAVIPVVSDPSLTATTPVDIDENDLIDTVYPTHSLSPTAPAQASSQELPPPSITSTQEQELHHNPHRHSPSVSDSVHPTHTKQKENRISKTPEYAMNQSIYMNRRDEFRRDDHYELSESTQQSPIDTITATISATGSNSTPINTSTATSGIPVRSFSNEFISRQQQHRQHLWTNDTPQSQLPQSSSSQIFSPNDNSHPNSIATLSNEEGDDAETSALRSPSAPHPIMGSDASTSVISVVRSVPLHVQHNYSSDPNEARQLLLHEAPLLSQQQQQQRQHSSIPANTIAGTRSVNTFTAGMTTSDTPSSTMVAIKLLISNNSAGSIIGRSGQSISELQMESQTRIKISQSSDYYPGTQDRVCLIQGPTVVTVKCAIRLVLQRCYQIQQGEWQQQQQQQSGEISRTATSLHPTPVPLQLMPPDRTGSIITGDEYDFILRLLVPISCGGMLIGKSGAFVKYMEEISGVISVRLTAKEDSQQQFMIPTNERTVTITSASVEQCIQCVNIVLDAMTAHPDISHYTNMTTSYVQHNHLIRNLPQAAQPFQYPMISNPLMQARRQEYHHRQPYYHHRPQNHPGTQLPIDPTTTYWPSTDSNMYTSSSTPTMHAMHHQQLPEPPSTAINRRVASLPNLTPGHPHANGRIVQTAFSDTTPQSYNAPSSPSRSTSSHHQQQFYAVQQHPSNLNHRQPQQRYNNNRYPPPALFPNPQRPDNIPQQQSHQHGLWVSQTASAPNLLSMPLEQTMAGPSQPSHAVVDGHGRSVHPSQPLPHEFSATMTSTTTFSPLTPARVLVQPSSIGPLSESDEPSQYLHPAMFDTDTFQSDVTTSTTSTSVLAVQVPSMIVPGWYMAQVLIPDAMIGSILGRGGRTLTEVQRSSSTTIRISQRNEYMPGTRSRIVTVRGPNPSSVWQAQHMLRHCLSTAVVPSFTSETTVATNRASSTTPTAPYPSIPTNPSSPPLTVAKNMVPTSAPIVITAAAAAAAAIAPPVSALSPTTTTFDDCNAVFTRPNGENSTR